MKGGTLDFVNLIVILYILDADLAFFFTACVMALLIIT
jgi:hypothetical protein